MRAAKEAVTAAEEALTAARERLRLADGRYAAGVGSIIELSDAELGAANAGAQRVGAEYALAAARAALVPRARPQVIGTRLAAQWPSGASLFRAGFTTDERSFLKYRAISTI